jgi:hypothetical protein
MKLKFDLALTTFMTYEKITATPMNIQTLGACATMNKGVIFP